MNVLVACEESQRVCKAFRELGYKAYSCDIKKCSVEGGGHPEWHILDDAINVLYCGRVKMQNGTWLDIDNWDLIIAHPPCTYLSNVASRHHSLKSTPKNRIDGRTVRRIQAMDFFMRIVQAPCQHIAIENPVGIMNTAYRKPDQIIDPFQFADSVDSEEYVTKKTCLWLKGLPPLKCNALPRPKNNEIFGVYKSGKNRTWEDCVHGSEKRSKTFMGIANAMAAQWGKYISNLSYRE